MFVAFVMLETRQLKTKYFLKPPGKTFKFGKNNEEYKIKRNMVYNKKFLFVKQYSFSMYVEGCSEPLEYTDSGFSIADVPLNEIAVILSMIKASVEEKIAMYASVGACLLAGIGLYYIYQVYQAMGLD